MSFWEFWKCTQNFGKSISPYPGNTLNLSGKTSMGEAWSFTAIRSCTLELLGKYFQKMGCIVDIITK